MGEARERAAAKVIGAEQVVAADRRQGLHQVLARWIGLDEPGPDDREGRDRADQGHARKATTRQRRRARRRREKHGGDGHAVLRRGSIARQARSTSVLSTTNSKPR